MKVGRQLSAPFDTRAVSLLGCVSFERIVNILQHRLDLAPPPPREAALLTLVCWTVAFMVYAPAALFTGRVAGALDIAVVIMTHIVVVAIAALLYFSFRFAAGKPYLIALPVLFVGTALTAITQLSADTFSEDLVRTLFNGPLAAPEDSYGMFIGLIFNAAVCACNLALFWITAASRRLRERELELFRSETLRLRSQLNMLRMQLDPHSLSNSLNAAASLVLQHRYSEARAMMISMADFMRSSAAIQDAEVSLRDELELIDTYLEVERQRFGERLQVEIDCDDQITEALVPSAVLQPLVENAIKHGADQAAGTVSISIRAERRHQELILEVDNESGSQSSPPASARAGGIGLANVRSRLALLFDNEASLTTESRATGFRTTIRLPFRLSEKVSSRPLSLFREASHNHTRMRPYKG